MSWSRTGGGGAILLLAAWACAGNPGPGEPGYAFNLMGYYQGQIVIQDMAIPVALELSTGPPGVVSGTYQVLDPMSMEGLVTGTLQADTVSLTLEYRNAADGCAGTLKGVGRVGEDGLSFSGRALIDDSCTGSLEGTFRFRKGSGNRP
jgi:hypothetical protein